MDAGRISIWLATTGLDPVPVDLVTVDLVMAAGLPSPALQTTASAFTARRTPAAEYNSRTNEVGPLVFKGRHGDTTTGASGWIAAAGQTLSPDDK